MPDNKDTKQLLLRISPSLYAKIVRMAEDDFRSVNSEIEYLLTMATKYLKRSSDWAREEEKEGHKDEE